MSVRSSIILPVDVPRGDEERIPLAQKGPLCHVITPLVLSGVCDTQLHCRGCEGGCVRVGEECEGVLGSERERERQREGKEMKQREK
jgi:hypothetical protein